MEWQPYIGLRNSLILLSNSAGSGPVQSYQEYHSIMSADQSLPPVKTDQHAVDLPRDFESALAELEALVVKMEEGELALDDSLLAYQRGVELARICQQRLDVAEEQVKVLQDNLLKPLTDATGEESA